MRNRYELVAKAYVQSMKAWDPTTVLPNSEILVRHLSRIPENDRNMLAASLIREGVSVSEAKSLLRLA